MGINFVLYKKRFSMALYYLDFKNNAQKRCSAFETFIR